MKFWAIFLTFGLFSFARGAFIRRVEEVRRLGCRTKEDVPPPRGWTKTTAAPKDQVIQLKVALKQSNFDALVQHLYEVSDPDHPRYGAYLSKEEVEALVSPSDDSPYVVDEWLRSAKISSAEIKKAPAGDWVTIRLPVHKAEQMLDTTFHVWTHDDSGISAIRTLSYGLPEHLHDHIDLVQPTTSFSRIKPKATLIRQLKAPKASLVEDQVLNLANGLSVNASCNETITIPCLKQLYNAVGYVPSAHSGNKIGITGYLEEFANIADLQKFYSEQVPEALNSNFTVFSINGGENTQNISDAGVEANLDVQYAFGGTFPTPQVFWTTGGSPPFVPDLVTPTNTNEPYLDWIEFVLSQKDSEIPQTISTSYADNEQTVPRSFAIRVCNEFAKLSARGVTLLFGSGDDGPGDGDGNPATQICKTNDGRNITQFLPEFPASCPFITSVGATHFINEIATDFSGGGFSNYFPRPPYQEKAVSEFLQKQLPKGTFAGLFNAAGRGIPDVAAQGDNFAFVFQGRDALVGGTSAATPAFASIVSLLNDALLQAGKPTLGFLNPLLYSKGLPGLNDITAGNAPGCGTQGFNATVGWDPITGLGTPNFGKLKDIVLPRK